MLIKIIIFGTILASVKAGLFGFGYGHVSSTNNVIHHIVPHHFATGSLTNDNRHHRYSLPKYEYEYSVADPHTGDHKTQHETRDGNAVRGYYNLVQPDGTLREVHYTADAHGYNAEVHNSAKSIHPAPTHGIHHNH